MSRFMLYCMLCIMCCVATRGSYTVQIIHPDSTTLSGLSVSFNGRSVTYVEYHDSAAFNVTPYRVTAAATGVSVVPTTIPDRTSRAPVMVTVYHRSQLFASWWTSRDSSLYEIGKGAGYSNQTSDTSREFTDVSLSNPANSLVGVAIALDNAADSVVVILWYLADSWFQKAVETTGPKLAPPPISQIPVHIYPMPTAGPCIFRLVLPREGTLNFDVYDAGGAIVLSQALTEHVSMGSTDISYDMNMAGILPNGVYTFVISLDAEVIAVQRAVLYR